MHAIQQQAAKPRTCSNFTLVKFSFGLPSICSLLKGGRRCLEPLEKLYQKLGAVLGQAVCPHESRRNPVKAVCCNDLLDGSNVNERSLVAQVRRVTHDYIVERLGVCCREVMESAANLVSGNVVEDLAE